MSDDEVFDKEAFEKITQVSEEIAQLIEWQPDDDTPYTLEEIEWLRFGAAIGAAWTLQALTIGPDGDYRAIDSALRVVRIYMEATERFVRREELS